MELLILSKIVNFFRHNFHGDGYLHYKTYEARKAYADGVLRLADRLFIAALLPILSIFYTESDNYYLQFFSSLSIFFGGVWLRHKGLLMIDYISRNRTRYNRAII